jgi:hypothetical protein
MTAAFRGKPTTIWVILMLTTLASFGSARQAGFGFALVMFAAGFKAHLIVRYYMELRSVPFAWRLLFDALIGSSVVMILGLHLLA